MPRVTIRTSWWPTAAPSRRPHWAIFAGLAIAVGIADQLLKAWVVATFDDARPTELLGDWLRIAITQNSGALFGLFRDQAGLFALFSLIVVGGIVWFHGRAGRQLLLSIALGLLLGGAMPFVFASFCMSAVGKAGKAVVEEVRRQFREKPGIMQGTVRTFDKAMRDDVIARIKRTVEQIAAASGATAALSIPLSTDVVFNDPALTSRMAPTLERVSVGKANPNGLWMPSEDFPAFTKEIPGLYVFMGVNKVGVSVDDAAPNHSPKFFVNEDALPTGVKTYVALAMDYLKGAPGRIP